MPLPENTIIGEIRFWAFDYNVRSGSGQWLFCDGSKYSISEHGQLYSLIGSFYGGDGRTTFAVPNLSGKGLVDEWQNQTVTSVDGRTKPSNPFSFIGIAAGENSTTFDQSKMPVHRHEVETRAASTPVMFASIDSATEVTPSGAPFMPAAGIAKLGFSTVPYAQYIEAENVTNKVSMGTLEAEGNGRLPLVGKHQAVENRQPQLAMGFYIAAEGEYPPRS